MATFLLLRRAREAGVNAFMMDLMFISEDYWSEKCQSDINAQQDMHFHFKRNARRGNKLLEIKWHFYDTRRTQSSVNNFIQRMSRGEMYHKTPVHKTLRARKYKVLNA